MIRTNLLSFIKPNIKSILVVAVVLFVVLTMFFSEFNGATDGLDRIGFPLVFMQDTGGKCVDCQSVKWFNVFCLIADLLISLLLGLLLVKVVSRKSNS